MLLINKNFRKFALAMSQDNLDIENTSAPQSPSEGSASALSASASAESASGEASVYMPQNQDRDADGNPKSRRLFKACAWLGMVLTVAAWCALIFSGGLAVGLGVAGVIVSAFGIRSPRGLVRDMAITSVVASAVLLVVLGIFYGLLAYLDHLIA